MTEKRFEYCIDEVGMYYYVYDNNKKGDDRVILELNTFFDAIEVCNLLNQLNEENEQLKQELKTKCIVNKQYEKNQQLIKMLDNVANYMQKEHQEMPLDDFVEWWNNIVTEGLE